MENLNKNQNILITGCLGFIGMHLSKSLLDEGFQVFGIDNINDYYDRSLKLDRKKYLKHYERFRFKKLDISSFDKLKQYFHNNRPRIVINLAAQAGVRFSIINPHAYIQSNVVGFMNLLECCKEYNIDSLIYASSSSVYGGNKDLPFSEKQKVDNPISIYAATKASNELMARSYNNLYDLKSTGLRFFTVYGAWGRPDMAYFIFAKKIINNEKIKVFNYGEMERDFTHIDDIIHGIRSAVSKNYDCEIFNLGNSKRENILDMVQIIEKKLNKKAIIDLLPIQPGDVKKTNANIDKAKKMLSFDPKTKFEDGITNFIDWFVDYYKY